MSTERIEFADAEAAPGGDDDLLAVGGPDGGHAPRRRWGRWIVGLVVAVLLAVLLIGRLAGGDGARPSATATPAPGFVARATPSVAPSVVGLIGLPRTITSPRELVTARSGDVVWMRDSGAGIVRIENGTSTNVQLLESQITAMAVSPSGDKLYVATGAGRPSIQILDATTLAFGASVPLTAGSVSAMAVSVDAVWAATGSRLLRLDLDTLSTLSTLSMPGVALTDHLRVGSDQTGNQQVVSGVVTGGDPTTTRLVHVDPLSEQVTFGQPLPGGADVASGPYLTWITHPGQAGGASVTQGYATVLDTQAQITARPPLAAGSRIYDGGSGEASFLAVAPHSSVIGCRDQAGAVVSEIDVAPALPDAQVTGQVLRSSSAFYVVTDRGLVREGVGDCH